MLETVRSWRGAVVAPHHQAARAGLRILEDGGNAVEAMIATAAVISVTYPHMNNLGGDNFWLIAPDGEDPVGIDACGAAPDRPASISTAPLAMTASRHAGHWPPLPSVARFPDGNVPMPTAAADLVAKFLCRICWRKPSPSPVAALR